MQLDEFIAQCKYARESGAKLRKLSVKSFFVGLLGIVIVSIGALLYGSVYVVLFGFLLGSIIPRYIKKGGAAECYKKDIVDRAQWIGIWLKEVCGSEVQESPFNSKGCVQVRINSDLLSINVAGLFESEVGEVSYEGRGQKLVFTNYDGLKAWLVGLPGLQAN